MTIRSSWPRHRSTARNLFPAAVPELRPAVLDWLDRVRPVADAVLRGVAIGLGLDADWFRANLTHDPTVLFRSLPLPAPARSSGRRVGRR